MERPASRQVRALVLDDLLKNIVQDGFGVVGVGYVAADTEDVSALFDVVLEVVIRTFVRELGHFDLFRGELFVEVVQI